MPNLREALLAATSWSSSVTPQQQITNYFNPTRADSAINTGYITSAGGTQGNPTTINGFVTSGLTPVTPGVTYTIDLYAADVAWILNTSTVTSGMFFYSASPANHANLTTLVNWASLVSFTVDGKSATFTVPMTMPATAYVAFDMKWAVGGSFVTGRIVPAGIQQDLLDSIMLNKSAAAVVQTTYGTPGTVDQVTAPLGLVAGQMAVIFNGQWDGAGNFLYGSIYIRCPWNVTYDIVQRMYYYAENYYNNNNLQFTSICLIPVATPGPSTPGAFGAALSVTTPSVICPYIQSDMAPPLGQDSGKFTGGAHGILGWLVPATAHGLTNTNRGAIFADGAAVQWTIARIGQATGGDPNNLLIIPQIAGPETDWTYGLPSVTGSTLTYVSGGAPTSPITITGSPVAQDIYPANQTTTISFAISGGVPSSNGVYVNTGFWIYLNYNIPNVFDIQTAIFGLNGVVTDSPSQYNDGPSQVNINLRYYCDPYAAMTAYYQATALQSYNRNSMWPSQNQGGIDMANYGGGDSFHEFFEGVMPFAPNYPQSGSLVDFSTFPDMSANVSEYWALAVNRQPPSYYKDQQPHNATFAIHGVQNSGIWTRKWCMANDDVDGRSANPALVPQSYLFSAGDKTYMVTANVQGTSAVAFNEQVPQGTADMSIGAFGMEHPALTDQNHSYGSFVYTKGGGSLAWRWYTPHVLTDYAIPVRADMIGKSIQIVKSAATVSVLDKVVSAGGVRVTTTGPGGFSVILS